MDVVRTQRKMARRGRGGGAAAGAVTESSGRGGGGQTTTKKKETEIKLSSFLEQTQQHRDGGVVGVGCVGGDAIVTAASSSSSQRSLGTDAAVVVAPTTATTTSVGAAVTTNHNNSPTDVTTTTTSSRRPSFLRRRRNPFERFRRRNRWSRGNGDDNHDDEQQQQHQQQQRRSCSAPPSTTRRKRQRYRRPLLEDHYRVDSSEGHGRAAVLPGALRYDANAARDAHDFFNLVVLIPVVALNAMNWNWDVLLWNAAATAASAAGGAGGGLLWWFPTSDVLRDAWTGEWFDWFFAATALYFVVDLIWVLLIPTAVKSPATIAQHHVATCLYIVIPYRHESCRFFMGACMAVEVNTWFLIARRVFNKQGFPPWTVIDLSFFSIRVKLISILFYVTWVMIRCMVYPYLMKAIYENYVHHSAAVGTKWNLVLLSVPLHAIFCLLNLKWSYDLLMSKMRYWRRRGYYNGKILQQQQQQQQQQQEEDDADKGL